MIEKSTTIGIIGCGVISRAYLTAIRDFPILTPRFVADLDLAASTACAQEFDLEAVSVAELLEDPDIEIVLNLTNPAAHVDIGLQAIAAGKHIYAEKPLGINTKEAKMLLDAAKRAGLRVGSAPDTFLGASHQNARQLIDDGAIGQVIAGTAFMMLPGHERWHPDPAFYYAMDGGGPLLDMGPYYLTNLIQLLGPVRRVSAFGNIFRRDRSIATGPKAGQSFSVKSLTHVAGTLEFGNGAIVQLATSFEVFAHRHSPLEIYGDNGSMIVPDPNFFDGVVEVANVEGDWRVAETNRHYNEGNYRGIGLADMASAIRQDRPHRASGALAFHVLEIMEGLLSSANDQIVVQMQSTVDRPQPLASDERIGQ